MLTTNAFFYRNTTSWAFDAEIMYIHAGLYPGIHSLYRNRVCRSFNAAIMYIRARLYPGISKYVLQKRLSYIFSTITPSSVLERTSGCVNLSITHNLSGGY